MNFKDFFSQSKCWNSSKGRFSQQYSSIYFSRLVTLRALILSGLSNKDLANFCTCSSILDIKISDIEFSKRSLIIGTFFIDDSSKPSILVDLGAVERSIETSCHWFLEDESGRVEIDPSSLINALIVSGMVVGLLGRENGGRFFAEEIFNVGLPQSRSLNVTDTKPPNILFMSDCNFSALKWSIFSEKVDAIMVNHSMFLEKI